MTRPIRSAMPPIRTINRPNDKIGVLGAMAIALALQSAFFLLLPNFAGFGTMLRMFAMLLMSAGMSTGTVEPPLLTAQAMGPRDFGKIWSVAGSAYTLGMAIGAPIWGLTFDPVEKSYTAGFLLSPVVLAGVLVLAAVGMRSGRRKHQAMHAEELAAWEAGIPVPA